MIAKKAAMTPQDKMLPPIVLTMGEPGGVGIEIALKAWQALRETRNTFFLLHDPVAVADLAQAIGLDVPIMKIDRPGEAPAMFASALPILPMKLPAPVVPGVLDVRSAPAVIEAIRRAVEFTTSGEASALVTNPIQKSALYAAGFQFPGHTEFLEHLAGDPFRATMMLAAEELRVVPVSIHVSLMSAITGLSTERIIATARATAMGLRQDFGILEPRLAIAGLNPHAGENGSMGCQEIEIIAPAVEALKSEGINARGPLSPDTMFTARARREYDAAICMYHDQALIPIKTLDMDGGVNVTLGLPFVRTSPDHGTALDIAGRGIAEPGSLVAAIELAAAIVGHRHKENMPCATSASG